MQRWQRAEALNDDGPVRIGRSIQRLLDSVGAPPASAIRAVFDGWQQIVGDALARHTRPLSLQDGVLTVAVDHPAWATQIHLLASDLLAKFEKELGETTVVALHVQVRADGWSG